MIDPAVVGGFALLLIRPGALVTSAPALGMLFTPVPVKAGLVAVLALALFPLVETPEAAGTTALGVIAARETAIGLALGFSVRLFIAGAEMAGHLTGFQLGFAYASLVDPASGVRNNIIAALYGSIALLVFLGTNAHHMLIGALALSYDALPVGVGGVDASIVEVAMDMAGVVFGLGARLAAPVVVVLIIVEIALGLMSRAAPALNILMMGFGVRVLVGLAVLAAVLGLLPIALEEAIPGVLQLAARTASAFR